MEQKIDKRDQKILAELENNARQSYNVIGKKRGTSKEVVNYRVEKLIELGVIKRFHTIINYFKLGIIKFKLYLRLTNANEAERERIGQYFNKHPKTEWVAQTTGKWDLIVGFLVSNINEFDDEVQKALNIYSPYIQQKAVTTTLHLIHQKRGFLSKINTQHTETVYHTSKDSKEAIDEKDEKILKILANNARLPITAIAKMANTTSRIVHYRIQELEKRGIILSYRTHLEPRTMGRLFCKVFFYLQNTTTKRLTTFMTYVSDLPEAVWPQRVMGTWDFELDLEMENYDKLQEIIRDLKAKFPDIIKDHEFCIVSKEYKLDLYPNALPTIKQDPKSTKHL